jgi:DNA-binding transcriptional LysR family regulator
MSVENHRPTRNSPGCAPIVALDPRIPTETGLALFDRAKRALEEADEADNAARGAAEGLPKAVLAHQGLTLASERMFAPELASGEVKTVMNDWTLPDMDLWAVFPTERMAGVKARAFVEYGCY